MQDDISVIYEDNHIFVANKPAGLLTQPSGTDRDSLEERAKRYLKSSRNKPGNVFLEAVHRLDRPVGGAVLFGCTSKALARLNDSVRKKSSQKTYVALIEGCPQEAGILEHYMVHDDMRARITSSAYPGAKEARLSYRVIERRGTISLIEIEPETGRYHQIRLQFSAIGCPIVGDGKYGSRIPFKISDAIALHHVRLKIPHPITQEILVFDAPAPKEFYGN